MVFLLFYKNGLNGGFEPERCWFNSKAIALP
jgi:hypothetical protein